MVQVTEVPADSPPDHTLAAQQLICLYLPSSIIASATGVHADHQPLAAPTQLDGIPGLILGHDVFRVEADAEPDTPATVEGDTRAPVEEELVGRQGQTRREELVEGRQAEVAAVGLRAQ